MDPQTQAELDRLRLLAETTQAQLNESLRLQQLEQDRTRKATVQSAVTVALSGYRFQSETGVRVFRDMVASKATVHTDGSVLAAGLPIDAYVRQELTQLDGLLAKGDSGGVQVSGHSHEPRVMGYDMDNITPEKMSDPKEAEKALRAIKKVGREAGFFRY